MTCGCSHAGLGQAGRDGNVMVSPPDLCFTTPIKSHYLFFFSSIIRRDHQLDTLKEHSHVADRPERPRRHRQKHAWPCLVNKVKSEQLARSMSRRALSAGA